MKTNGTLARRFPSHLLAQYPIRWHRGKEIWTAWPVGLPVIAMDGTKKRPGDGCTERYKVTLNVCLSAISLFLYLRGKSKLP